MEEFQNQIYYFVGFLVVTNIVTLYRLYLDKQKEIEKRIETEKQEVVQITTIQNQMTSLSMAIGEIKESMKELRKDLNAAYGKWRDNNGSL